MGRVREGENFEPTAFDESVLRSVHFSAVVTQINLLIELVATYGQKLIRISACSSGQKTRRSLTYVNCR